MIDLEKVAEKAWNAANDADLDSFEACIVLKDAAMAIKQAKEIISSLEKDAGRLDWLESSKKSHGFCHTGYGDYRHYVHRYNGARSVREVIDTAMESKHES